MPARRSLSFVTASFRNAIVAETFDLTVAAVVEHSDRFLVVEENVGGRHVFNQPAGHVEPGETLIEAAIREAREETGYVFRPTELLGIYVWQDPESQRNFVRVALTGTAIEPTGVPTLDHGIVAVHWLSRQQLYDRDARLRSPMVLQCIDDYIAGASYSMDALVHLSSSIEGIAKSA